MLKALSSSESKKPVLDSTCCGWAPAGANPKAEIARSKSEGRNPRAERNPKAEIRRGRSCKAGVHSVLRGMRNAPRSYPGLIAPLICLGMEMHYTPLLVLACT